MTKPKKIILLFLLTLANFITAQITVSGKVVDSRNKPIEFANVVLLNQENSEITIGTVTDEKGMFSITSAKEGKFITCK